MFDFQTIAGIASIISLVISVFALFRANSVKKSYKEEISDIRIKMKDFVVNMDGSSGNEVNQGIVAKTTINYYEAADGKLSGISSSLEELSGIPAISNSADDRKTLHILSDRRNALKTQYKEYRDVQRLPHNSEKVITLLAEISGLEFEIEELRKRIGKVD